MDYAHPVNGYAHPVNGYAHPVNGYAHQDEARLIELRAQTRGGHNLPDGHLYQRWKWLLMSDCICDVCKNMHAKHD